MSTFIFILFALTAVYAFWQRQRRAWTERAMVGCGQAAKFANRLFTVQWVGEREPDEPIDQIIMGLIDPVNLPGVRPVLIIDTGHPNFNLCAALKQDDQVLVTFNPEGWKWGDEAVCAQSNWVRHVFVAKQN